MAVNKAQKKSRIKLLLLLFLFMTPVLLSFILFFGLGKDFFPSGRSNHAPLITPYVTLDIFQQQQVPIEAKWTIVHRVGENCDEACQQVLYNTRQIRAALGKNVHRVQRLIVSSDTGTLTTLKAAHADAIWPAPSEFDSSAIESIFEAQNLAEIDALLIDPKGNAMMVIPHTLSPRLFLKDIKKLLRNSHIG